MVSMSTVRGNRDTILRIAGQHGARRVRVFGSVAGGSQSERGDLDLLVAFEPDRSLLDHVALIQDLEEALGCRVDVVSERALHPRIRDQVLAEAVAL